MMLSKRHVSYQELYGWTWDGRSRGGEIVARRINKTWTIVSELFMTCDRIATAQDMSDQTLSNVKGIYRIKLLPVQANLPTECVHECTIDGSSARCVMVPCFIEVKVGRQQRTIIGCFVQDYAGTKFGLASIEPTDPMLVGLDFGLAKMSDVCGSLCSDVPTAPGFSPKLPPDHVRKEDQFVDPTTRVESVEDELLKQRSSTPIVEKTVVSSPLVVGDKVTFTETERVDDHPQEIANAFRRALEKKIEDLPHITLNGKRVLSFSVIPTPRYKQTPFGPVEIRNVIPPAINHGVRAFVAKGCVFRGFDAEKRATIFNAGYPPRVIVDKSGATTDGPFLTGDPVVDSIEDDTPIDQLVPDSPPYNPQF